MRNVERFSLGSPNPVRNRHHDPHPNAHRNPQYNPNSHYNPNPRYNPLSKLYTYSSSQKQIEKLRNEFFTAAQELDLNGIRKCLERNLDVNVTNELKENALHLALHTIHKRSRRKKQAELKRYNRRLQDQEEENEDGAVLDDCDAQSTDEAAFTRYLIEAGLDINKHDCYGNTCVHIASDDRLLHVLDVMYAIANPDINKRSTTNRRPIDDAALLRHLETLKRHVSHLDKNSNNQFQITLSKKPTLHSRNSLGQFQDRQYRKSSILHKNSSFMKPQKGILKTWSSNEDAVVGGIMSELQSVLDDCDEDGMTVLHYAVLGGNTEIVAHLLENGADPLLYTTQGDYQKTPLHLAALHGNTEVAKLLIDKNSKLLDIPDELGNTALHTAVFKDMYDMVEILLSKGASIKVKNHGSRTPLDEAYLIEPVNQDIIDLILNNRKKKKKEPQTKSKDPTMAKKEAGLLFSKIGDIKDIGGKFRKAIDRDKAKDDINTHVYEDKYLELDNLSKEFLEAAAAANTGVIKSYLKQGVQPGVQNRDGETALHLLITQGHPDIGSLINMILDAGPALNCTTNRGETALHYAANRGSSVSLRILLDRGSDPNVQDLRGQTALFKVSAEKLSIPDTISCAKILIKYKANVNTANKQGLTPLHIASKYGKQSLMKLLIDSGADVSLVDSQNRTALHHIFRMSHDSDADQIDILVPLHGSPAINIRDKSGDTPLHMAARSQRPLTMIALLEKGADPNLVSSRVPKQRALEILYQDFLVNKNEDHEITNDFSIAEQIGEPELILRSPSPILTAMNYSKIFSQIAESKDDCSTYAGLSVACEELAVDLLQTCHNMDDARIILQQKDYLVFKTASQDQHKKFIALCYTIYKDWSITNEEYNTSEQWIIIILMAADIIFALNTLIIFGRLLTYFQVSPLLGPLQLSLFRMATDVLLVLVILGIVMFAFAASMTKVYLVGYYSVPPNLNATEREKLMNPDIEGVPPLIPDTVSNMGSSLVSLYWSLYGLLDVEDFESSYYVSNAFGKILLGLYLVLAVIVLLNMLIAKISNTYANIQENSRLEWNYARANLIIEYQESQDLPIPFNFIQTIIRGVVNLFSRCCRCLCRKQVVEVEADKNVDQAVETNPKIDIKETAEGSTPHPDTVSNTNVGNNKVVKGSGNGSSSKKDKDKERDLAEQLEQHEVDRILEYIRSDYLKKQEEMMRYSLKELHNKMRGKINTLEEQVTLMWNEINAWKTDTDDRMQSMHKNFAGAQEILRKYLRQRFVDRV
uniref:Uncharacterized protein LOC102803898 n=1 Tax=Saccoglossus kowalevskii TaxID=10224 RepID=A0ABM0ML07_SACKO|nr:PREDICTED: uncharacterized protein LOC102803898 [Saccoglossus kowalevskii]